MAGLPQTVKFTLLTGHYAVKKGDALQLSNSETMPILPSSSCTTRISTPTTGQPTLLEQKYKQKRLFHRLNVVVSVTRSELVGESTLSIQSSEKVTSISLPPTPPYHTLEFHLEVLCIIPSGSERPANERLTNGEVRHRPRSYSHPDTPMTAVDQRVRQTLSGRVDGGSTSCFFSCTAGCQHLDESLDDLFKCAEPVIFKGSLFILRCFNAPPSVIELVIKLVWCFIVLYLFIKTWACVRYL